MPPWHCSLSFVRNGANIVVFGGTGSGKTTFLNALGQLIDPTDRIVTVEDAAELRFPGEHVVRLEARRPNSEGQGEVTIRDLVRAALRLRPDRVVVGEVRGPEALDMVWALSTGHDGSLSTVHADGAAEALRRLESFVQMAAPGLSPPAIEAQLRSGVDYLVGVTRTDTRARRVTSIAEVEPQGLDVRPLFEAGEVVAEPRRRPRRVGAS